jgi:HAE1 family hydrophobic/amphiphilic exporter-1
MLITEGSIRRPITTTMIFLIVITLGMISFRFLPVDLLPPIETPELSVQVSYPNVGPEEIEQLITEPLENALAIVANIERMTSFSQEGSGRVQLTFSRDTNMEEAMNDVRDALDRVRRRLPIDADAPRIGRFNPDDSAIVVIGAQSDRDLADLSRILERELRRRFEQIPGVGSIDVWGSINYEVRIDVVRDRLLASGLTMNDIVQAIGRESATLPGGNVRSGLSDLYIRSLGEYANIEEIRSTVIRSVDGVPVRVGDVATVSYERRDIGRYIEIDDVPMLRLGIRKQSGANTVAVAEAIKREAERINLERNDLNLIIVTDQSTFIQESIDNVRNSAIWGGILAIIILLAFLRNGSTTAIIAISIPIAIIATFGLLYFGGLTLNQMSFGGLALGVGLIVDNAIVVIENIVRQRQQNRLPRKRAAALGTRQVTGAIIASTITTMVIFLPVVFMQTLTGSMFQELAMVVAFALICSLLVALTLVPMLASRFMSITPYPANQSGTGNPPARRQGSEDDDDFDAIDYREQDCKAPRRHFMDGVEARYGKLLSWALRRRLVVVALTLSLMGGAIYGMQGLSFDLAPEMQADDIRIRMFMDEGTNIAILHSYMMEMDQIVRAIIPWEDVLHYTRDVTNSRAEIELTMIGQDQRSTNSDDLADRIRREVQTAIPGMRVQVRTQSGLWILRRVFRSGGDDAVQVELRGHDLAMAEEISQTIRERIETIPGIADANVSQQEGRPEQNIRFDRERMASLGIGVNDISRAIQASIGGTRAGIFRDQGDEIDIIVRLRPDDRLNIQDIDNIAVRAADGTAVPISSLVTMSAERGPTTIRRINGQRVSYINANLDSGVPLGEAVRRIQADLRDFPLPPGFSIVYGGEWEEQQRAQRDFTLAIVMAMVLIYMVMAAQFERFLDPLIVMFSVPLALIGVVPTLILTGTTLNMQSFMGLIMLIGIVVNNAIVLVDYINLLRREQKLPVLQAVEQAGRLRLRPILMTTLTTILAMLPLAMGIGAGAEMQAALARVVIGGLAASSLITLVFIPIVYVAAHSVRENLVGRLTTLRFAREQPDEGKGELSTARD